MSPPENSSESSPPQEEDHYTWRRRERELALLNPPRSEEPVPQSDGLFSQDDDSYLAELELQNHMPPFVNSRPRPVPNPLPHATFAVPRDPKYLGGRPQVKEFVDNRRDYEEWSRTGQAKIDRNVEYHHFKHSSEQYADNRLDPADGIRSSKEKDEEKIFKEVIDNRVPNASFFHFKKEDHTLGNMLSGRLQKLPFVLFAAYKIPHPLEHVMQLRIETDGSMTPGRALAFASQSLDQDLDLLSKRLAREVLLKTAENEVSYVNSFSKYAGELVDDERELSRLSKISHRPAPNKDRMTQHQAKLFDELFAPIRSFVDLSVCAVTAQEKDKLSVWAVRKREIEGCVREIMRENYTTKMNNAALVAIDKTVIQQAIHHAFDTHNKNAGQKVPKIKEPTKAPGGKVSRKATVEDDPDNNSCVTN